MKYYSEVLEQLFDTQDDLQKAENEFEKANASKNAIKNKVLLHMKKGMSEIEKAHNFAEQYAEIATDDEALEIISELVRSVTDCMSKMGADYRIFRI